MTTHTADGITIDITDTEATLTIDGQFAAHMGRPNWKPEHNTGDRVFLAIANMITYAGSRRPNPEYVNADLVLVSIERLNAFRIAVRGYGAIFGADQAENKLVGEGYDRDDVQAAIDSLIAAGLMIDDLTADDQRWITDTEMRILRSKLAAGGAGR